jgi:predicted NBD/HSP70 family sugar kinase
VNDVLTPQRPPRLVSSTDIGRTNRARVIQALCDHGPLSRADLARLASVPRATIGGIVQPLVDADLLEEVETSTPAGRGGKPARPLWFRRTSGISATASLHESACRVALVNARGEVLDEAEAAVDLEPGTNADQCTRAVARTLKLILPKTGRVIGVGMAVPGVCDSERGVVVGSVQVPAWTDYPLARELSGLLDLEAFIDNDARCQALGEKWFGEGRGVSTFASIQTGQGLGVGLVVDGTIFRGEGGLTGELGHTPVAGAGPDEGQPCLCGLRGCWETVAGLGWLRSQAAARKLPAANQMTSERLAALVAAGNAEAADLLQRYAANVATGLATLINLLNPQRLILHGDLATGGPAVLDAVREETKARSLVYLRPRLEIMSSALGERASLVGAAGLVLSERFHLIAD